MTLFKELCGSEFMKNVVVVTTSWDGPAFQDKAVANETMLKNIPGFWKDLCDAGSKFVRYGHFQAEDRPKSNEFLTPHDIVDHLLGLEPPASGLIA
jgi:hypothetical protein